MIEELLKNVKNHVDYFFNHVEILQLKQIFEQLLKRQGTVFFTGVGKSGLIAKKIAMTMSSTGTHALYLSPVNALHGDLGIVSSGDTVLILSKSGESEELLQLCPALRNKGTYLIAVSSTKESRLAKACDTLVLLPVLKELCPYDLAPTTSTIIQLIFGDVLAMALMHAKKFSLDDYAKNHPAGRIGKRMTFKVQDLMLKGKDLPICKPQDKLVEVLVELSDKRCGCIMAVDALSKLKGVFTDGDLRRSLQIHGAHALNMLIEDLMTKTPQTIAPDILAFDALKMMESNQRKAVTVLPVIDKDQVVGLIKLHDIVQSGL